MAWFKSPEASATRPACQHATPPPPKCFKRKGLAGHERTSRTRFTFSITHLSRGTDNTMSKTVTGAEPHTLFLTSSAIDKAAATDILINLPNLCNALYLGSPETSRSYS
eukprot:jgi/Botrbrau1/3370/Bobra.0337s0011.1